MANVLKYQKFEFYLSIVFTKLSAQTHKQSVSFSPIVSIINSIAHNLIVINYLEQNFILSFDLRSD